MAALVAASGLLLTGCFNGPRATTSVQAGMNSGNGAQVQIGSIKIENATLVLGPEGSQSATLLTRLINVGTEADTLLGVTINGQPADVTSGTPTLNPNASVPFGFAADAWINTYALDVPVSTYVPVTMSFLNAGNTTFEVLTVPPLGYYEGIAPNPPTKP
jgi:hypothetical protein